MALYDTNQTNNYQPAPSYIDAYDYAGGSSGYNRAAKGSSEGAISNTVGGVLENIPVVSSFYKIGNAAYKGLKSTNSGTGDFFSHFFSPHHQWLATLDDSVKLNKRKKNLDYTTNKYGATVIGGNKQVVKQFARDTTRNSTEGMLNIFGLGAVASIGQGKDNREEEQRKLDYNANLQRFYSEQTGLQATPYQTMNPVRYDSSITQGLIGGAMGLFNQYGGKGGGQGGGQQNNGQAMMLEGYGTPNNGYSYPQENMGGNPAQPISVNAQGNNYNWNSGEYGFEDGGVAIVKGGKGNDDVALVDTVTGNDTGVRVTKGEMLVIKKENVEALENALKSKNKNAVFKIMKEQFDAVPNDNMGTDGYAEGGKIKEIKYIPNTTSAEDMKKFLADPDFSYMVVDENGNELGALTDQFGTVDWMNLQPKTLKEESRRPEDIVYGKELQTAPLTDNEAIARSVYESNVPVKPTFMDKMKGVNLDTIAGNAYDGFRFGMGLQSSRDALPEWQIPDDYIAYGQQLKTNSTRGLTPVEIASLNQQSNQNLVYGKENVYNLSNGSAGTALANINNLGANRMDDAIKISTLDKAQQRANLADYGGFLKGATTYDRMQFTDKLLQAERTKSASAQLAQDAYHNIQDRNDYTQTYGSGSNYQEYQNAILKEKLMDIQAKQNYMNSLKTKDSFIQGQPR